MMTGVDWLIVFVPLVIVLAVAGYTRRYTRSVADFMAAGRCAGRYLLCNARGEAGAGVSSSVAQWQQIMVAGFVLNWWWSLQLPIMVLLSILGFVIYRYRQTRAMTLAQFFEIRYSRRFRVFMGWLGFLAGIANYGIFPAVGGIFFVYLLGLPEQVTILSVNVPTHLLIAAGYLSTSLFFVLVGGQVTLMVTDAIEGMISALMYVVVIVALLTIFRWEQIATVLSSNPPGQSLINPFDSLKTKDFNLWFVVMYITTHIYGTMTWQSGHGFNASGYTPHDNRMGDVLGRWRNNARVIFLVVVGICAMTYLRHPDFAPQSAQVQQVLDGIENPAVRSQVQVPIAARMMMPMGILGVFCAIKLFMLLAGDAAHLHSWGTILAQDIILPQRKKQMSAKTHLRLLRWCIVGVAVFAFCFSALVKQTQYVIMWWAVTMSIYIGGAGAAVIGGLYWKKGTTAAAWAAVGLGITLSMTGLLARQINPEFPLNGQQVYFVTMLVCATAYIVVSLLSCREDFNLDRMLHRGKYARADEAAIAPKQLSWRDRLRVSNILGFSKDFTASDKFAAGFLFWYMTFWFVVVAVGSIWNLIAPWPDSWWLNYWRVQALMLPIVFSAITAVWFTIGGVHDLIVFFRRLKALKRDERDDGTVINHHNLDEEAANNNQPAPESTPGRPSTLLAR